MVNPDPATRVSYDLADVLDKIDAKIDHMNDAVEDLRAQLAANQHRLEERIAVIEAKPPPILNGDHRMMTVEQEVKDLRTRVQTLEQREQQRFGVSAFWKGTALILGTVIAIGQLGAAVVLILQ